MSVTSSNKKNRRVDFIFYEGDSVVLLEGDKRLNPGPIFFPDNRIGAVKYLYFIYNIITCIGTAVTADNDIFDLFRDETNHVRRR